MSLTLNTNFLEFLNGEKHIFHRLCHLTVVFIISNVNCLFHQILIEYIIFQIYLENSYVKNYVILEEKLTLINDFSNIT